MSRRTDSPDRADLDLGGGLLDRALTGLLSTTTTDGRIQTTPVWYARSGGEVLVSTMREFAKARNVSARPVAGLLVMDPERVDHWVELRADVVLDDVDAERVLDDIGWRYSGVRPYFGAIVAAELSVIEHPVTLRLVPVAVRRPPVLSDPRSAVPAPEPPRLGPSALPPSRGCAGDAPLPHDHLDLLDAPIVAAFATALPSGVPQTQPVWFSRDGGDLLVHTTLQRRKARNLLADPRATLLVVDPSDSTRWVEVRADVDLSTDGAEDLLDQATRSYTRHRHYYGGIAPRWQRGYETRVVARLHPRVVHCDAIHR